MRLDVWNKPNISPRVENDDVLVRVAVSVGMSYDIDNASVLNTHDHILEAHPAGAFKHFVLFITPVEFTHVIRVSQRVPFVNRLEMLPLLSATQPAVLCQFPHGLGGTGGVGGAGPKTGRKGGGALWREKYHGETALNFCRKKSAEIRLGCREHRFGDRLLFKDKWIAHDKRGDLSPFLQFRPEFFHAPKRDMSG